MLIHGSEVERVSEYLGCMIDHNLDLNKHVDMVSSKLNSRFYCLRTLNQLNVDNTLLGLFYSSVFVSIISYCIVCFGGLVAKGDKDSIGGIIRKAERIVG